MALKASLVCDACGLETEATECHDRAPRGTLMRAKIVRGWKRIEQDGTHRDYCPGCATRLALFRGNNSRPGRRK